MIKLIAIYCTAADIFILYTNIRYYLNHIVLTFINKKYNVYAFKLYKHMV